MIALSHNREEIVRLLLEEDYIIKVPQEGPKEDYDEEDEQRHESSVNYRKRQHESRSDNNSSSSSNNSKRQHHESSSYNNNNERSSSNVTSSHIIESLPHHSLQIVSFSEEMVKETEDKDAKLAS